MRREQLFALALGLLVASGAAHAAEHVTLTNGFDLICDHHSAAGDRVRLYMDSGSTNFVEVDAAEIASSEHVDLPAAPPKATSASRSNGRITDAELHELVARAGGAHDLDVDLLASVIRQESGGNARAVSRTGAQGLMQLMPRHGSRSRRRQCLRARRQRQRWNRLFGQSAQALPRQPRVGPGRLQCGARSRRPVARCPALPRNPGLRRPRDPRVQPPRSCPREDEKQEVADPVGNCHTLTAPRIMEIAF